MNKGGAPLGNKNAARSGRPFGDAVNYEIAAVGRKVREKRKRDGEAESGDVDGALSVGMRHLAKRLILSALEDKPLSTAIKEVADRIEGKSTTAVELSGRDGGPIEIDGLSITLVKPGQENEDGEED